MKTPTILLAAILGSTVASAQDPLSSELRQQWATIRNTLTKSADRMPEADYSFKPAPGNTVTFGQIIGHIADGHIGICSAAKGEPRHTNSETSKTTKADLVAALKESSDYCDSAYDSLTDAALNQQIDYYGRMRSRLSVLYFTIIHDNEMYGQIVAYYRAKNMVPPTTADRPTTGKKK
jgi:DinB superfamily